MPNTVEIAIPVDGDAPHALRSPARREAAGRYLSALLKEGQVADLLREAIAEAKGEARTQGLTDSEIEAELEAWRAERNT